MTLKQSLRAIVALALITAVVILLPSRTNACGPFFTDASPRMQVDLLALSDRIRGWSSNYKWLREVGVEAVEKHKAKYARGVATTLWQLLRQGLYRVDTAPSTSNTGGGADSSRLSISAADRGGVGVCVPGMDLNAVQLWG